jgi:hypothetical protein
MPRSSGQPHYLESVESRAHYFERREIRAVEGTGDFFTNAETQSDVLFSENG